MLHDLHDGIMRKQDEIDSLQKSIGDSGRVKSGLRAHVWTSVCCRRRGELYTTAQLLAALAAALCTLRWDARAQERWFVCMLSVVGPHALVIEPARVALCALVASRTTGPATTADPGPRSRRTSFDS
eukprot:gene680-13567_t